MRCVCGSVGCTAQRQPLPHIALFRKWAYNGCMPAPDGPQFKSVKEMLEAQGRKLYHGTPEAFTPRTRKVWPVSRATEGGYDAFGKLAHATSDINEALLYGNHVYEVYPDEHTYEGYGDTAFFSEKGFKIKKKVR